jgi:hypothetical protein
MRGVVALTVLAVAAVAGRASGAPPQPTLNLKPFWQSGKMGRIGIEGRHWVVSAECPDAIPLSYSVRGSAGETLLASVTLLRPAGSFAFTWQVPPRAQGRVLVLRMRERCVSAAGGPHTFAAAAALRIR